MRFRLVILALLAVTAQARVISYAPYTNRVATPALQHRMNRHFVLFEDSGQIIRTLLPLPSKRSPPFQAGASWMPSAIAALR